MADGQVVNKVTVRLPDGTVREYPRGTTVREVAQDLGGRIAQEALVARVNGRLVDRVFPAGRRRGDRALDA